MEFLGDIAGGLLSGASGGIFGLLGSVVGGWFKLQHVKEEREKIKEERAYKLELMEKKMAVAAAETENELKIVAQTGSWQAMDATHRADAAAMKNAPSWAAGVRALFRPILTISLIGLSAAMFILILNAFQDGQGLMATLFSAEQQMELLRYMIYTIFFAASSSAMWWYGERSFAPPGMKNR